MTDSLPLGWSQARIGDLIGTDGIFIDGDWVESKDQDPNGDVRLIQLADVGDGSYLNKSRRFLTSGKATDLRCTYLTAGDVLIARMPDPLGRSCIFPGDPMPAVTVVDVCIVRTGSPGVNHRWLAWAINSPKFRDAIAFLQSGSTRKRISRGNLATLTLPIPPIAEQQRIVDVIEEQFTRLDAAIVGLKRVQQQLRRYRASVLKAACEGRLVPTEADLARAEGRAYEPAARLVSRIVDERRQRWEDAELAKVQAVGRLPLTDTWKSRYEEPLEPTVPLQTDVPEGWTWVTVDQVSTLIQYGSSAKTSEASRGVPVLRMGNIVNGRLETTNEGSLKFLPDEHPEFPELLLAPDDALFNRTNSAELVGKTAIYRGSPSPCSFASYLIRVRPCALFRSEMLAYYINSAHGRAWITTVVSQQVGQANVNGSKLRALTIPLPPLAEQERIVAEVERRLSVIEKAEAVVAANLKRAERMRQAILKRAFEGKLVPQDPNDEPASVLLERIRAERELARGAAPKPRGRRSAVTAKQDGPERNRQLRLLDADAAVEARQRVVRRDR